MAKRGSTPAWTNEQKETLLHLYKTTKLSYRKIGEQINRTQHAVYHMLKTLNYGNKG